MKKTLILLVAVMIGISASAQLKAPKIVAHRGFHATEGSDKNTISSLLNAQKLGVYGSECDVSLSADDSLMVVHGSMHPDRRIPSAHRAHVTKDVYKDIRAISCKGGNIVPTLRVGTGNKLNGGDLRVADIYSTSGCALARVMRRELKERGIKRLPVVYSAESRPAEGRRVPATVAYMPAIAGLLISEQIMKELIK